MVPFIIAIMTLAFVVVFLFPRHGLLLVWPVLFLYPQEYLFGLLPLNAGLDDLFILFVAGRALFTYAPPIYSRASRMVILLSVFVVLMQLMADIGSLTYLPQLLPGALKVLLKNLVVLFYVWTLVRSVRTREDIRRQLIAFGVAASFAGVIVVASLYKPELTGAWEVRSPGLEYLEGTMNKRAFGPFNGPAEVAGFACMVVPLAAGLLLQGRGAGQVVRMLAGAMIVMGTLSLLVAKTRSGMIGLVACIIAIIVTARQRRYVLVIGSVLAIVVAISVLAAGGDVLGAVEARFATETIAQDTATRLNIWVKVASTPSWLTFLVGESVTPMAMRLNATPHNGYLDALFIWGPFGFVTFSMFFFYMLKWSRTAMKLHVDPVSRGLGAGVFWSGISVLALSFLSDPWFMAYYRIGSFFMLALVAIPYSDVVEQESEERGNWIRRRHT